MLAILPRLPCDIARPRRLHSGFVAKHRVVRQRTSLRPRLTFPCMNGNAADRTMKRLLLLAPAVALTATLAACGSSSGPARDASAPLVYVSSSRTPASIAACLDERLSRVRASHAGGVTELAVGADSNNSYFITLTPLNGSTVIKVMHPANAPDDPPEAEMRFAIARCAT
ncbi:hypothetical protein LJ655_02980 [Paraburkholderia sp. MMS20-SJTN17]|uniref:Sugar ABC transporter ATPase n=1 Tax=Paraburkholderia translucens TaxID=2886945 RepID=A0ABS8K7Z6_9BURK|nr:hypothetical protein [Paraburkholderia sp. MMS20-SJTN17]MCC8400866.1 hypothetical protein [Paraburkholderia sp. MMS20-SJTN17]